MTLAAPAPDFFAPGPATYRPLTLFPDGGLLEHRALLEWTCALIPHKEHTNNHLALMNALNAREAYYAEFPQLR